MVFDQRRCFLSQAVNVLATCLLVSLLLLSPFLVSIAPAASDRPAGECNFEIGDFFESAERLLHSTRIRTLYSSPELARLLRNLGSSLNNFDINELLNTLRQQKLFCPSGVVLRVHSSTVDGVGRLHRWARLVDLRSALLEADPQKVGLLRVERELLDLVQTMATPQLSLQLNFRDANIAALVAGQLSTLLFPALQSYGFTTSDERHTIGASLVTLLRRITNDDRIIESMLAEEGSLSELAVKSQEHLDRCQLTVSIRAEDTRLLIQLGGAASPGADTLLPGEFRGGWDLQPLNAQLEALHQTFADLCRGDVALAYDKIDTLDLAFDSDDMTFWLNQLGLRGEFSGCCDASALQFQVTSEDSSHSIPLVGCDTLRWIPPQHQEVLLFGDRDLPQLLRTLLVDLESNITTSSLRNSWLETNESTTNAFVLLNPDSYRGLLDLVRKPAVGFELRLALLSESGASIESLRLRLAGDSYQLSSLPVPRVLLLQKVSDPASAMAYIERVIEEALHDVATALGVVHNADQALVIESNCGFGVPTYLLSQPAVGERLGTDLELQAVGDFLPHIVLIDGHLILSTSRALTTRVLATAKDSASSFEIPAGTAQTVSYQHISSATIAACCQTLSEGLLAVGGWSGKVQSADGQPWPSKPVAWCHVGSQLVDVITHITSWIESVETTLEKRANGHQRKTQVSWSTERPPTPPLPPHTRLLVKEGVRSPQHALLSPDQRYLIALGLDRVVAVWDLESERQVQRFAVGEYGCCALSADGAQLVVGGYNGVEVWDLQNELRIAQLKGVRDVRAVAFSPERSRVALFDENTALFWNFASGAVEQRLTFSGNGRGIRFSNDGSHLALGVDGEGVTLWSYPQLQSLGQFGNKAGRCIEFSNDGAQLYVGTVNSLGIGNGLEIWDIDKQERLCNEPRIQVRAFDVDRGTFVGLDKNSLAVRSLESLQTIQPLVESDPLYRSASYSTDGKLIIGSDRKQGIRLWKTSTGAAQFVPQPPFPVVSRVAVSPGEQHLATLRGGELTVWSLITGKTELFLPAHEESIEAFTFSEDGHSIITVGHDRSALSDPRFCLIRLWSIAGRSLELSRDLAFSGRDSAITDVHSIGDHRWLVLGGAKETHAVDLVGGRWIGSFPGKLSQTMAATLFATIDGEAKIWDLFCGAPLAKPGPGRHMTVASLTDQAQLLTSSPGPLVSLWDLQTSRERFRCSNADLRVETAEHHAGGLWFRSKSGVQRLDIAASTTRPILFPHAQKIMCVRQRWAALLRDDEQGIIDFYDMTHEPPQLVCSLVDLPQEDWVALTAGGKIDGTHHGIDTLRHLQSRKSYPLKSHPRAEGLLAEALLGLRIGQPQRQAQLNLAKTPPDADALKYDMALPDGFKTRHRLFGGTRVDGASLTILRFSSATAPPTPHWKLVSEPERVEVQGQSATLQLHETTLGGRSWSRQQLSLNFRDQLVVATATYPATEADVAAIRESLLGLQVSAPNSDPLPEDRDVESAQAAGVKWLLAQQNRDGSWSAERGLQGNDPFEVTAVGLTAMILYALSTRGYTHRDGFDKEQRRAIGAGLGWLLNQQQENSEGKLGTTVADHAWGLLAFGNLLALSRDRTLLSAPTTSAISTFLAWERDGGYGEVPNTKPRLMATLVMQLGATGARYVVSSRLVNVTEAPLKQRRTETLKWLTQNAKLDRVANAQLPWLIASWLRGHMHSDSSEVQEAVARLHSVPLSIESEPLFLMSGADVMCWGKKVDANLEWLDRCAAQLLAQQQLDGSDKGSWPARGAMALTGGRTAATAAAAITLSSISFSLRNR